MNHAVPMPANIGREIARLAELRLQATKEISAITVARATTLCGTFGAGGVALIAAVLAYFGTDHPNGRLIAAGAATAVILLFAAALAAYASASRDIRIAGADPIELRHWCWESDAGRWRSEDELQDALGQKLAEAIEANRALLAREGSLVNVSLWVALAAIVLGLLLYFL